MKILTITTICAIQGQQFSMLEFNCLQRLSNFKSIRNFHTNLSQEVKGLSLSPTYASYRKSINSDVTNNVKMQLEDYDQK